nr:PLP-dependent aminotransferase family protein [Acidocella aromatica]
MVHATLEHDETAGAECVKKRASFGSLIALTLDAAQPEPLYQQLYEQLRGAIVGSRLPGGTRLPASRVLAQELKLSRNTVTSAYELLSNEGYILTRVGDGAYVANILPEDRLLPRKSSKADGPPPAASHPSLSARGRLLTELSVTAGPAQPVPFVADLPAFDAFPLHAWARLMVQSWRQVQPDMLGYADPAGYEPLRELISQHLKATRFLDCVGQDVIMTSGSQQSLDLLARVLLDHGDSVWVEEPGYVGTRSALIAAGARLVPVPVDGQGLLVSAGEMLEPRPRLIFITPSRQYPLGMTMSMERRKELLAFAEKSGAWIVEDDYDSEFRYHGTPLPAVQSLDRTGRVIYLGTFSKSLLPSFRLGFLVVPGYLARAFGNAKSVIDRHPSLLEQMTLLGFMQSGQFAAHIRRMRQLYEERQQVLIQEIERKLGGFLQITQAESGMHLVAELPDGVDDVSFCQAAKSWGVSVQPLSAYYTAEPRRNGVILGFAAIPPKSIVRGVERLAAAVASGQATPPARKLPPGPPVR